MAVSTIGSAWSGYQASVWNGIQTFRLADASALSRESNEKAISAGQQRALDGALFVEFARNLFLGNRDLANFIRARMRPELNNAIEAWLATNPRTNPSAPLTPFAMPEYRVPAAEEASNLEQKSAAAKATGQKANRNSDTYTLSGVLYTAALFLAGLVASIREVRTRRIVLVLSLINLAIALAVMTTLPVAHRA